MASLQLSRGLLACRTLGRIQKPRLFATSIGFQSKQTSAGKQKVKPVSANVSTEPFVNTQYLCPEYYSHGLYAFYDFDVEMAKHRLDCPDKYSGIYYKAKFTKPVE